MVLRLFFFMLQTYLCGSRKPQNIFCVHTKYRLPERAKFRHTTPSFVSKFPVPYVFSEVNNIKFYTDLSHFANVATYTKKCSVTTQKKGGDCLYLYFYLMLFIPFLILQKASQKEDIKKVSFIWHCPKLALTPTPSHPFWAYLRYLLFLYILYNCEVTFLLA